MAMIKCKECGNEISSKAKTCPNCGAKLKKPIYKKTGFYILIIIIALIFALTIKGNINKSAQNIDLTIIEGDSTKIVQLNDVRETLRNNPAQYDLMYKGKEVVFISEITNIEGKGIYNGAHLDGCIRVKGNIAIYIHKDSNIIPTLNVGDKICVKGELMRRTDNVEIFIGKTTQTSLAKV